MKIIKSTCCLTLMIVGILSLLSATPIIIYDIVKIVKYDGRSFSFSNAEIVFLISFITQLLNAWTGLRAVISAKKSRPVWGLTTTCLISLITLTFYLIIAIINREVTNLVNLFEFILGYSLQIIMILDVRYLKKISQK